jgi:hypothetical protein
MCVCIHVSWLNHGYRVATEQFSGSPACPGLSHTLTPVYHVGSLLVNATGAGPQASEGSDTCSSCSWSPMAHPFSLSSSELSPLSLRPGKEREVTARVRVRGMLIGRGGVREPLLSLLAEKKMEFTYHNYRSEVYSSVVSCTHKVVRLLSL